MGGAALLVLLLTRGAVGLLVVLYSINVFITFSLSQLGMVRHWWQVRHEEAAWRLADWPINARGSRSHQFHPGDPGGAEVRRRWLGDGTDDHGA